MSYHSGDQLINPQVLFEKARFRPDMHVADFGAGRTGHIVFPAGLVVGEKGVVYAVDILKDVLESIRKRAALENCLNIHPVWADIEQEGMVAIPKASLDAVFMVNVLFHCKKLAAPLNEAERLLQDKGRIIIVDWVKRLANLGPREEDFVDFSQIEEWARSHNFAIQDDFALSQYHRCVVLFRHE